MDRVLLIRSEVMTTVTIARRFRGPPNSANGGDACGLVAAESHPDLRVLRREVNSKG